MTPGDTWRREFDAMWDDTHLPDPSLRPALILAGIGLLAVAAVWWWLR